jgi:hypothetical protein
LINCRTCLKTLNKWHFLCHNVSSKTTAQEIRYFYKRLQCSGNLQSKHTRTRTRARARDWRSFSFFFCQEWACIYAVFYILYFYLRYVCFVCIRSESCLPLFFYFCYYSLVWFDMYDYRFNVYIAVWITHFTFVFQGSLLNVFRGLKVFPLVFVFWCFYWNRFSVSFHNNWWWA